MAADRRHYETGEPLHSEYRMIARDGRVLWILDTATITVGSDGHRYSQGVLSDVSERKERERQLVAAEERFRLLVERTPVVTYQEITGETYDASTSMVYVSPQMQWAVPSSCLNGAPTGQPGGGGMMPPGY